MNERLAHIAELVLAGKERLFLVDLKVSGKSGPQKVVVLIDGDRGVGIDDCSKVSREMAAIIEEQDLISGKYILEVSSPGVDSPLKLPRQYPQHIGRKLKLNLNDGQEIKGMLKEVSESSVSVEKEAKKKDKESRAEIVEIPFNNIEKAKVLISF